MYKPATEIVYSVTYHKQDVPSRDLRKLLNLSIFSQWSGLNCILGMGGNVSNTTRVACLRKCSSNNRIVQHISDTSFFWNS